MDKAKSEGLITGVIPHLIEGRGITHLQYADDTIVMCEGDAKLITHMKYLLYCFEWMNGLKINYHKSEVVTFGMDKNTEVNIDNILNCKIGQLPLTCLGFPISDTRVGVAVFKDIVGKMRNRLQPWKGKNLTSRGRLILTNTSLSSLPIYIMSIL
jgi:hypothetical protein